MLRSPTPNPGAGSHGCHNDAVASHLTSVTSPPAEQRKSVLRAAVLLTVWVVLLCGPAVAADFPSPQGRVNDFAGVLDEATEAALRAMIDLAERDAKAEIAVVTVGSLEGLTVEQYAEGLFRAWGIGKAGADNGVLVLVCPLERAMRIEVGYGLEGVLPDGLAGSIIRQQFTPAFKDGDYARGLIEGVRRVTEIVRAHHVLTAEELARMAAAEDAAIRPPTWLMTPFFGLFIALGAGALGVGTRTKSMFPLLWGGLFGGIPGVMALIPFFNAALWVLVPLAVIMFALGYFKGASVMAAGSGGGGTGRGKGGSGRGSGGSSSSGSNWTSGSSSGSSWSGGSSSSSGSSFGGGRSGGGGASGSW